MKNNIIFHFISSFLISRVLSECLFNKFGYSCCSNESTPVVFTDEDADWGIENNEWCAIRPYCWSLSYGYPCCKNTKEVIFSDHAGDWGIEYDNWCGLSNYIPYNFTLDGMYIKAKNYMSKIVVKNPIPEHVNDKAEGVIVEKKSYYSDVTESKRKLNVVLPSNYTTDKKYPVLYLLHGIFSDEDYMLQESIGALNIPANLAKDGKAKEMIIVSPNEFAQPPGVNLKDEITKEYLAIYDNFINELLNNIMPFIESNYSIAKGRENTAIAGFSMGGRNALYIGYTRPDIFGYVAGFSPAWGITPVLYSDLFNGLFPSERDFKIKDPNKYTPYVTLICTGTEDSVVEDFPLQYHRILTSNQQNHIWIEVEGADHDDRAIIVGVYNFVASLFGVLMPEDNSI